MITEGIHDAIPFDQYLSGDPSVPSVSGSDLVAFETECPAHAYALWRCNPARVRRDGSAAMTLGSAAHAYILEGADAFHERYAVKPENMSFATKEGKAWREQNGDRQVISFDDHMRIVAMSSSLHQIPEAARLLKAPGRAEVTMAVEDSETGLMLLCRPDWYIAKAGLSVNLKTTQSPAPNAWRRTAANLRYDLGDAMFRFVAGMLGVAHPSHCFMVVGSQPPHLGYVAALSAEAAANADIQLRQILRRFADCVASGRWPGYADGVIEIGLPAYAANQIADSIQKGYEQ